MLRGSPHSTQYPDAGDPLYLTPVQVCAVMSGIMTLVDSTGEPLDEDSIPHPLRARVVRTLEDLMMLVREAWVPYCKAIHERRQQLAHVGEESDETSEADD